MTSEQAKARFEDVSGKLRRQIEEHGKTRDFLGALAINTTLELIAVMIEVMSLVESQEREIIELKAKVERIENPVLTPY